MNNIYFTIFLIVTIFTTLFIRFLELRLLERRKHPGKIYARWTVLAFAAGYIIIIAGTLIEYFLVERKISITISIVGFILLIIKTVIKIWASKALGQHWSSDIEISPEHQLIKAGPYKYIRHPAYLSSMLDTVGIPLLANAFYTIIPALVIRLSIILIRIGIEEKALIEKFGEDYINYRNETGAVIPVIRKGRKKTNYESIVNPTTNQ